MSRPSKEGYLLDVAELTAKRSTCDRLQVGAVLASDDLTLFVVGYNGGAKGGANSCRHPDQEGGCGCVHAEMNAVAKATYGVHVKAFVTVSPCVLCATLLVNAGVTEVHFLREYRDTEGLDVLYESGVKLVVYGGHKVYPLRKGMGVPFASALEYARR